MLKIQEICPQKRFIFTSKCTKCVWWPGSARTHWGAYSAPPDPLTGLRGSGEGKGREGQGGIERGEEGKGRTPQCLTYVR